MRKRLFLIIFISVLKLSSSMGQEEKFIGLFVYNFTKYFDWPENLKAGDFVIQILGHKTVYDELLTITAGKRVGSQQIVLKQLSDHKEVTKCHLLFVGHWQSRNLPAILANIEGYPCMVVTEMEGLIEKGAAINFVISDASIKFEMNITNISARKLKTDPRIKELAFRVIE